MSAVFDSFGIELDVLIIELMEEGDRAHSENEAFARGKFLDDMAEGEMDASLLCYLLLPRGWLKGVVDLL